MDSETTNEENYLCHEFNEEYEMLQHDYYRNLNKDELLKECFDILSELNKLQTTVNKLTHENAKLNQKLVEYENAKLEESTMI
jgi:predicted nuclease with TOPRIM domain